MTEKLVSISLALPWGELPPNPPAAVSPKVHLVRWFTSGFE